VGPAAYAASKFGLVGLSEATGLSWASRGITVTQLNPGFIETEGFTQAQIKRSPLARLVGQPDDVARAIHGAIVRAQTERTVPGWYRGVVLARHLASPVFRIGVARMARAQGTRD
jgi:NAD(P)-dependent dehydrogenase (short-subunit alcohol dehydrogenase family)